MKFLVDENVGQSVVRYLVEKGYNVVVATSKELVSREDAFLLNYAFHEERVIITNDKDFGFLVYHQKLPSYGIILFRFTQELPSCKIEALETILSRKPEQILNYFIVASEGKIRSRPLIR